MIDYARFEDLLIVRKIREKIRKWWDIELSYADERGYVLDHAEGKIVPPHNVFCRAALESPASFQRCNRSVEEAIATIREARSIRAHIFPSCHLGFPLVLVPVVDESGFHGAIFAGGFLIEDEVEARRDALLSNVAEQGLRIHDAGAAYGRIPTISRRDLDYFCDLLETTVEEMVEFSHVLHDKETRIRELSGELSGRYQFGNIVGKSAPMVRMFSLLEKVAQTDSTVLVTGENGTGKELIARAIHYNGPRRDRTFVATNVSALNDNLLESELFGHVKGAFTGATRNKQGLFKVADGGTFFLDEVGDMSMAMQVKLLRVLQEGTFLPVGATAPERVDVRIITATNRNLSDLVKKRTFREDLFYRLNVINVEVPPLRTRKEDIPLLVEFFLEAHAQKLGTGKKKLASDVMARFYAYNWPGNVRELENEVERLVVLAGDEAVIGDDVLGAAIRGADDGRNVERFRLKGDLASAVAALEREMIREGLVATHWNKTRLAERLGVSRTTLIKKIKEYGIEDGKNPLHQAAG
jgi:two-component system, NtrC family, response regulator HupR/HoxA